MAKESVDEVIQWYDDCATLYDQNFNSAGFQFHLTTVEATLEFVKDKDAAILDLGAGTGTIGDLLKKEGYSNMDALDASQGMLDIASKKNLYKNTFRSLIGTSESIENLAEAHNPEVLCALYLTLVIGNLLHLHTKVCTIQTISPGAPQCTTATCPLGDFP
ncbi:putative Williams-Beuren syndrome chromosomal region 27 protein-like [Apostichopus japonicus]|uniref:Putative Williams-Beuren syndrome chromosomal region 27 protein-like n=1 Tax=Stichopus japonicus TaxID=307972 RepID=A0A2G8JEK9_STIJA|nr:putative Williams-Beuren syndrome chromosomal region 27 protein-like [Apostichopus japonicus]